MNDKRSFQISKRKINVHRSQSLMYKKIKKSLLDFLGYNLISEQKISKINLNLHKQIINEQIVFAIVVFKVVALHVHIQFFLNPLCSLYLNSIKFRFKIAWKAFKCYEKRALRIMPIWLLYDAVKLNWSLIYFYINPVFLF